MYGAIQRSLEELKGKKAEDIQAWAIKESIRNLWACVTEKEGQAFLKAGIVGLLEAV